MLVSWVWTWRRWEQWRNNDLFCGVGFVLWYEIGSIAIGISARWLLGLDEAERLNCGSDQALGKAHSYAYVG